MKINFKVTTECPANCICCRERLLNFEKFSHVEKRREELFAKILSIYKKVDDRENQLSITGGEPTLIPDLPYFVKKMTENNITVGVDTNGWNINRKWLAEMERAGLNYLLLSVYSLKQDIYNYLRGAENEQLFARMKEAICVLKKYKEDGGTIRVRMQTVLMKPNFRETPILLEEAIQSHFDSLSTAYYISNEPEEKILMDQSDIEYFVKKVCPEMILIMEKCNMDKILRDANKEKIKTFFNIKDVDLGKISKGIYRRSGCNCSESNRISIYPNGVAVPCLGFDYIMDESYGLNIFQDEQFKTLIDKRFVDFWKRDHVLCKRCSSGSQVWLNLSF